MKVCCTLSSSLDLLQMKEKVFQNKFMYTFNSKNVWNPLTGVIGIQFENSRVSSMDEMLSPIFF